MRNRMILHLFSGFLCFVLLLSCSGVESNPEEVVTSSGDESDDAAVSAEEVPIPVDEEPAVVSPPDTAVGDEVAGDEEPAEKAASFFDHETGEFAIIQLPDGWQEVPDSAISSEFGDFDGLSIESFTRKFYDEDRRSISISVARGPAEVLAVQGEFEVPNDIRIEGATSFTVLRMPEQGDWTLLSFQPEGVEGYGITLTGSSGVSVEDLTEFVTLMREQGSK